MDETCHVSMREIDKDSVLRNLMECTASATGERFFNCIVEGLSKALGTEGAWCTVLNKEKKTLRALAFLMQGEWLEDYEYDFTGSVCEAVILADKLVHHPDNVMDIYPDSDTLKSYKAVSFMGAPLKDKDGYWVGTALEPYGLVYHPRKIQRLGIPEPREWEDLLNPKLRGEVAQCAPTRSSSSNATYEVILSMHGEEKGWEWLKKLAANTGHFTARSRDVPTVVAKGEYSAGFAVPSYMAFEEKLAGFDIKFVAPKNAFVTPEPMAILTGSRNPRAARAFIEFLLTERGQKVFMERGLFPITPKYRVQGGPGSPAELAVQFTGGVRSYFDSEVSNVYDEAIAAKRSDGLKKKYRSDIEATWKKP